MKIKTSFGILTLKKGIPDYIEKDGFYIIFKPKTGAMLENYITIAQIYIDMETQEYKLSVIGQSNEYSEELFRYKDWYFSDKLIDTFDFIAK